MDALSPTKISVLPPETTNGVSSDHAVNPEHGGKPDEGTLICSLNKLWLSVGMYSHRYIQRG